MTNKINNYLGSMYPSLNELIPPSLEAKIPGSLYKDIANRYLTLGPAYLTDFLTVDGRPINGMMYSDRVVNCIEEIVDAQFCVIGEIFKRNAKGIDPGENLYTLLDGINQIYSLLVAESESMNALSAEEAV